MSIMLNITVIVKKFTSLKYLVIELLFVKKNWARVFIIISHIKRHKLKVYTVIDNLRYMVNSDMSLNERCPVHRLVRLFIIYTKPAHKLFINVIYFL